MSEAVENYLKVIYTLQDKEGKVTTSALAEQLGVSPASASGMLSKLAHLKLIRHRRYKGAQLTAQGRKLALQVIRRHRLAELWLREVLGLPLHLVHAEAHKWEHVLSDEVVFRLDKLLDHPDRDPHGAPIPTADGQLSSDSGICLAEVAVGQAVVINEVNDDDPDLVQYLEDHGLLPAVHLVVLDRQPFDGPVTLRVGKTDQVVGANITRQILVRTDLDPERDNQNMTHSGTSTSEENS